MFHLFNRFFIRNKSTLQQRHRVCSLFDQGKKKNIETLANKSTLQQWHKVRLLSDQGTKTNIEAWLKRVAITKMLFMVCSGLVVLLGIDALYAGYIEKNRIPRVVKKFETGSRDLNIPKEATFFPREKETTELKELISPSTPGFFNLVTGEHGTGKTTLVCHTCKNTPVGVLYIRIPDDPAELTTTLGNSVDFDFEVHISFWSQLRGRFFAREVPRTSELNLVLDGISSASQCYAAIHKKPVIIFIDNLTVLAKQKDIEPFQRLVRFAKTEADGGDLIVNFVASEGHTPRQLAELSEGSRLSMVVEIGDLDENQAIKFITRSGTDETTAKGIFNIVGGRVTYLIDAQLRMQKGETLKAIKESFVNRADKEFGDLNLPMDPSELTLKQKKAWKQIIRIYNSPNKEISYPDFRDSIGSASLADELLQRNVFAYHHGKNTVSLHSRPTELFVEQKQQVLKDPKFKYFT